MKLSDIVSRDPEVMNGALVFSGTRVPVEVLMQHLTARMNPRAMSEWMVPAASRATVPRRIVQARTVVRRIDRALGMQEAGQGSRTSSSTERTTTA